MLPSTLNWWRTGDLDALATQGLNAVAMLFFAGAGLLIRTLRDETARSAALLQQVQASQAALEEAHRQLQESAARRQEMAVLEERQRIAREIHDSVAHALTALVVQAQVCRRLIVPDPEQAAAAAARCEEMARAALQETRQAVRALHPSGLDKQTDLEALQRLGRDYGIATGMAVTVTVDAAAAALAPDPIRLEQLYRIFQETLTNAQRHGQAGTVEAALTVAGDTLFITEGTAKNHVSSIIEKLGLRDRTQAAVWAVRQGLA